MVFVVYNMIKRLNRSTLIACIGFQSSVFGFFILHLDSNRLVMNY